MLIILTASKSAVMEEVAKRTGYMGAKHPDGPADYDRLQTIDEDETILNSHFDECRTELVLLLSYMTEWEGMGLSPDDPNPSVVDTEDLYKLELNVSDTFNNLLVPSLDNMLFFFFVYGILSRWYMYTKKEDVDSYAVLSTSMLSKLHAKVRQFVFTRKISTF